MLNKEILKLTPRIIEHILSWGGVKSRTRVWTKHDAKVYLFLESLRRQMNSEKYLERKEAYNKSK